MPLAAIRASVQVPPDPAYPTNSVADAIYPCQTRVPFAPPFDGVATPSMWSRLEAPLGWALDQLWHELGLLERARPSRWVTLHYGRMALNAHGWDRLRAGWSGEPPDPSIGGPGTGGLGRLALLWERFRVRRGRTRVLRRVERAEAFCEGRLQEEVRRDPGELDAAELARGPLDERSWGELFLPWLVTQMAGVSAGAGRIDPTLGTALGLERRSATELGRRLAAQRVLESPVHVAFLTVDERIRAVLEPTDRWAKLVASRRERVDSFLDVEIPDQFWGRPRVATEVEG